MNKKVSLSILLLISLFISCSESGPNNPEENVDYREQLSKLFPYSTDRTFEFNVDTLNTTKNEFERFGKRSFKIITTENFNDLSYSSGVQKYSYSNGEINLNTRFRLSEKSILLLADTTNSTQGFPEELLSIMTIYFDPEMNLLELPLKINKPWPVVKSTVDFQTFKFNTIEVVAEYVGKETLVLEGFTNPFETEKVVYTLIINMPNIENPFVSNTNKYYARIWYAEDYGIVKMEGCSLILNPVVGVNINFADSNAVSRHLLTTVKDGI